MPRKYSGISESELREVIYKYVVDYMNDFNLSLSLYLINRRWGAEIRGATGKSVLEFFEAEPDRYLVGRDRECRTFIGAHSVLERPDFTNVGY